MGLVLLVGLADGALAAGNRRAWLLALATPAGALPLAWFPPAWAALHASCGIAGWQAWRRAGAGSALRLWGWALAAAAARAAAFFGLHNIGLALGIGIVTMVLLGVLVRRFGAIDRIAGLLMVPTLLWTVYILYLDAGLLLLNSR